uniref:Uncharacterized protein n=2 Tax=Rhodosorus marinus TaxID=101924 RepID=A0A7S3A906_9RHOD|mmetsp:Transcript_778/g.1913  ORF Transcript_778/g.1913 Transcript_778/m.1913 type:complete len:302 (+) Transcript_778:337-1242(+)|eukprot:CAMPEP_0113960996 /NCGR_PEP_ID=MMETSP0011_2-20120614/5046_1 /TAXON_ID=101924 /ORGANISM="Rhodosorus marinus" /LENGTH=301 /DNA_ID=CAMNT_0000972553 /DNA_START=138 /DNA_END=1043 /DNA_ORIENTATION=+ /assembly_acc=CAM_ASM_000156
MTAFVRPDDSWRRSSPITGFDVGGFSSPTDSPRSSPSVSQNKMEAIQFPISPTSAVTNTDSDTSSEEDLQLGRYDIAKKVTADGRNHRNPNVFEIEGKRQEVPDRPCRDSHPSKLSPGVLRRKYSIPLSENQMRNVRADDDDLRTPRKRLSGIFIGLPDQERESSPWFNDLPDRSSQSTSDFLPRDSSSISDSGSENSVNNEKAMTMPSPWFAASEGISNTDYDEFITSVRTSQRYSTRTKYAHPRTLHKQESWVTTVVRKATLSSANTESDANSSEGATSSQKGKRGFLRRVFKKRSVVE